MEIKDAIEILKKHVPNPSYGLPDEIFYYISETTPLINVDLLIQDEKGRTLLAWRDDQYAGKGWHIPGGIIRFKETFETRIKKVAKSEIGTEVDFDPNPLAINQIINEERDVRGHFISILYKCSLPPDFAPENKGMKETDPGYLQWHETCPDNLLKFHDAIYRQYL
ncbi:MAG: hypothetical protein UY31_C0059G0001, partial [Candidatus Wolfebacteria bacterium GW2011_GWE1_48_7]|uniref:Nudix hydrolase domain-containing protein n=2 Tax=Candidatus Wolfeibacteriota TaxID=1752735 RepID=A0A0G1WI02_9BACT